MFGFPTANKFKDAPEDDWREREVQNLKNGQFEQVHGNEPNTYAASYRAHCDVAANSQPRINGRTLLVEDRDDAVSTKLEDALHENFEYKLCEQFKDDFHVSMSGRTTEGFYETFARFSQTTQNRDSIR